MTLGSGEGREVVGHDMIVGYSLDWRSERASEFSELVGKGIRLDTSSKFWLEAVKKRETRDAMYVCSSYFMLRTV